MEYYTLADVGHVTGIDYQLLYRAVLTGRLPKPTETLPMRRSRYYNEAAFRDVVKIVEAEKAKSSEV
jgi:hypothetical protein